MKKLILGLTIGILFVSCQKTKIDTEVSITKSQSNSVFGDKDWRLVSVLTTPAIWDLDGDGKKDSELISTLQGDEKMKILRFTSDGKVLAKEMTSLVKGNVNEPQQIGIWKSDPTSNSITWIRSDGTVIEAKAKVVSENMIKLICKSGKTEIIYTLLN